MSFVALAFALLAFTSQLQTSQTFLETNPALGVYQDAEQCFPAQSEFHLMYRNYKDDPNYGGTAKCVYAVQNDPVVRDSTVMTFIYGGKKKQARMIFSSGPGYTEKNVVNIKYLDGSHIEFNLTAAYLACSQCHILRSDYIDGGEGCMLWVPGNALNENHSCCNFVFDLLCGNSTKYQIYDGCK